MGEQSRAFQQLTGPIEDYFDVRGVFAGTLTAQAFNAVELSNNQSVTLWKTRGPLVAAEIGRFRARLDLLKGLPRVQPILWCGVDTDNVGFAVLSTYDGRRIDCAAKTRKEVEGRFDSCLSVMEGLHAKSVACGDLCLESFLLNDRGSVSLFAVLGDVRLEYEEEDFKRERYEAFRPPEQKSGGVQKPSVDAYALAWIGEGIFAIKVSEERVASAAPPAWLKNILQATSSEQLRSETSSALALRLVVDSHQESVGDADVLAQGSENFALVQVDEPPKEGSGDRVADRELAQSIRDSKGAREARFAKGNSPASSGSSKLALISTALGDATRIFRMPSRLVVLAVLNVVAIGALFLVYVEGRASAVRIEVAKVVQIRQDGAWDTSIADLYASDKNDGHKELLNLVSSTIIGSKREQAARTLIFRARRLGLDRTSDAILRQFTGGKTEEVFVVDDGSVALLRILNPKASQNSRLEGLVVMYDQNPQLAVVLAAALALDTGETEAFRGIFAKAISDQLGVPKGGEHSPFAMMLLLPEVNDLFSEDILAMQDKISSSDITWLLQELGRKGQSQVSSVAKLAYHRKVVSGVSSVFLNELQRDAALSQGLRSSLVAGALGKLSQDDVARFGQWYGQGASRALQAGILTSESSDVARAAFEALGSRTTSDVYVAKVMEFVWHTYKADSAKFGGLIAALALRDVIDAQTMHRELEKVDGAPRRAEFLKRLVRGAPPEVLQPLLKRFSASIDPLDVIDLLGHPSKDVRLVAVSQLTTVNDILLLKLISQSYDEEEDEQVRAAYEQKISVIRDRKRAAA